jgi:aspartokinase-like uncharacterized kinase
MNGGWQHGIIRGDRDPTGTSPAPLVIKLGGSLLARPHWPTDLINLLAGTPLPAMLVVGGGKLVDALRRIDVTSPRPAEVMHRLAIDALGLTARLVADAIGLPLVTAPPPDQPAVPPPAGPRIAVLDVPVWLTATGSPAWIERLPVGWHVTSDSIAAVIAAELGHRLLLVKSVPPPCPGDDLPALAAAGWIDGYFPTAAATLNMIGWAALENRGRE